MKIRIYDEPRGEALGGTEVYAAILAGALSTGGHSVEILHHRPQMTCEQLARFASVDLKDVRCRYFPSPAIIRGPAWKSLARYREERKWEASISNECDIFISLNHETLLFCSAPLGILIVLFPFYDPAQSGYETNAGSRAGGLRTKVRSLWHKWKLKKRLRNYQVRTAISQFSGRWTKERWAVDCEILYPPVDLQSFSTEKSNRILSVGRFATGRHGKNQLEMLEAFGDLKKTGWRDWSYDCVGARGSSKEDLAFFAKAEELAHEAGADVAANMDRTALRLLYGEAKIFWHAAGMNSDEETQPELAEHFGITTVEAMSAGCVPVVVNKGGQPEIVEHGVSGFVWNTAAELKEYTTRLMADDELRTRMSSAARLRAEGFSRREFLRRFEQLLAPHVKLSLEAASNR